MANLVIVESAAKAKTIEKYLNSIPELSHLGIFKVLASLGHIRDLPLKKTGIDTTAWTVEYEATSSKAAVIKKLKDAAKTSKIVWIASDMDLEGNAIAFHLREVLHLKRTQYHRVIFNEITKSALKTAFLNPGDIDMRMFAAQETRRILDRIVGYELSPLLWRRFVTKSLSAGRVQSAALQMIKARYQKAQEHLPETYWTCDADFKISSLSDQLKTCLYALSTDKTTAIVQWPIEMKPQIEKFLQQLIDFAICTKPWHIQFAQKQVFKKPTAPFTTSTFQQEVYNRYHIPPKSAMRSAQTLYEGGYITYMRTDSVQISEDAQAAIIKYSTKTYGKENTSPRQFKTKQQNAQEAHEAIRPSNPETLASHLPENFTEIDRKIYTLIWRQAVASQMASAEYLEVSYTLPLPIEIKVSFAKSPFFYGKKQILVREGYLLALSPDIIADPQQLTIWKNISTKETPAKFVALVCEPNITKSQTLFNEASIVKSLEKEGIGRPSTYASILDKLFTRTYIIKGEAPKKSVTADMYSWTLENAYIKTVKELHTATNDKDLLLPTSLGERVVDYLQPIVPFLLDTAFTSHMESDLDKIMTGETDKVSTLRDFYKIFHAAVESAKTTLSEKSSSTKQTNTNTKMPKEESILHRYSDTLVVVKTRYGPAMLEDSKWYSIKPFMEWKKKDYNELTLQDITFIKSLPRTIETTDRQLTLGPYGLYIKDAAFNNYILPEKHWDTAYTNSLSPEYIKSLQPVQSKKKPSAAKPRKGDAKTSQLPRRKKSQ